MALTKSHLTPKELADVIGASESSLRRWTDGGQIRMSRTAGGHRRIPVQEAIRFIRETGAPLVRPELLGLRDLPQSDPDARYTDDEERLFQALLAGDRPVGVGLISSWYLQGRTLAALFDGPVRGAMHRIGELWRHEERGILIEHRATDICLHAVLELGTMQPPPSPDAPVALGAAPEADPYLLPTAMAGLVVSEAGYRAINYGAQTPLSLLAHAAAEQNAPLVWISITAPPEKRRMQREIVDLAGKLAACGARLVVGGQQSAEVAPPGVGNLQTVGSMAELSAYARGVIGSGSGRGATASASPAQPQSPR